MGNKGGSSWLTVVKRAFRSPTKDTSEKKSSRRREENEQDEEEEKKREKRRWLFRKPCSHNNINNAPPHSKAKVSTLCAPPPPKTAPQVLASDQRHAIAVAAAAAEAAVATAQAAVEIIRLTRSSKNPTSSLSLPVKQSYAAVVIQTAFRGYLARKALVALKGIVKLQAIIRGQNVRKQAKVTLKCMQALLRLQTRMRDHQARLSHDGGGGERKSMFAETNNLWESRYLRDIRERRSLSKERICIPDDWSECPRTLVELEAALQARKEAVAAAALKRESSLAYAFSQQIWDSSESGYDQQQKEEVEVDEEQERTKRLDKWMATKQWDTCSRSRGSIDKRDSITKTKTVEMDIPFPEGKQQQQQQQHSASYYSSSANGSHELQKQSAPVPVPRYSSAAASPGRHRSLNHYNCSSNMVPVTPSPSKTKPVQARPSSPRSGCRLKLREDKGYSYSYSYSYSAANTPCGSLRSMQRLNSSSSSSRYSVSTNTNNVTDQGNNNNNVNNGNASSGTLLPNYMAATESAKARVRSQSAPRQRPSTPERERGASGTSMGAKKRLSFPVPPDDQPLNIGSTATTSINASYGFSQNLRSPSFKSVQAGYVGMDLHSNQSCYTDSIDGGEISPCSTTDLRRWLR